MEVELKSKEQYNVLFEKNIRFFRLNRVIFTKGNIKNYSVSFHIRVRFEQSNGGFGTDGRGCYLKDELPIQIDLFKIFENNQYKWIAIESMELENKGNCTIVLDFELS